MKRFGPWFRDRAHKLYNNRKFCTCCCYGCGNPRRESTRPAKQHPCHDATDGKRGQEKGTKHLLPVSQPRDGHDRHCLTFTTKYVTV